MTTTVVNKHHKVPYDVYVGRGSKWGNPFTHMEGTQAEFVVGSRNEAVESYREWIKEQPELLASLHELKGKVLACYCHPQSCHGHVLAELTDALEESDMVKTKGLTTELQQYKNIPLELIHRGYPRDGKAKRFALNGTNQNVWIPNVYLNADGSLKENINIDFVFKKSYNQLRISGITTIGYIYDDHFRLVIAGGREFTDYKLLKRKCDKILSRITKPITIISGSANGADSLGERYANENGYNLYIMPASWKEHGNSAGHVRNRQMADTASACITFWDGKSPGTKGMIDYCNKIDLQLRVIRYDQY